MIGAIGRSGKTDSKLWYASEKPFWKCIVLGRLGVAAIGFGGVLIANEFETILWGENMEAEYTTAKEWYKANRRELKKYRGQWIVYNHQVDHFNLIFKQYRK